MTLEPGPAPLKWTSQFSVQPESKTSALRGDRIVLPPLALEQLLSAATTTVQVEPQPHPRDFDPYNPYSLAAQRRARETTFERQQNLPHPLTFRLVNPRNGKIVFAGIREFSAQDGEVGISPFLRESLGLRQNDLNHTLVDESHEDLPNEELTDRLTVHVQELQKGTYVKLRPLEAGYDPEDWKALLERYLRDNFTTLTSGELLTVSAGKEEYRFLVDELKPSGEAISLVDTDLEVDIEALNEEQARETLKQRMKKIQRAPGTREGSSIGGVVEVGLSLSGQVIPGEYVDYALEDWDRSQTVEIALVSNDPARDLDLYVSPAGPKQRARPRQDEHVFGDMSTTPTKQIRILPTNTALEGTEHLWVSVGGYRPPSDESVTINHTGPIRYKLHVSVDSSMASNNNSNTVSDRQIHAGETMCKNCYQWVPTRTMMLHENFCFRNNVLCPHCQNVFQKSSTDWKDHWHCPHDDSYGSSFVSHQKHDALFHAPQQCSICEYQAKNMPDLAQHRTSICPGKLILCSFCHLIVPQQGPDDPSPTDPEVIFSGLTPHELTDGARTTECHLCGKIVRLRDMSTHLKHHDYQRLSRAKPRICRNVNCGRTIDRISKTGEVHPQKATEGNEIGVCDLCFGPLYVSMYDPDGKALKRRVERKYLTQILTGCGQSWCQNDFCKTGRKNLGIEAPMGSKEGMAAIKPFLEGLRGSAMPVHFCVDEASQRRRGLAEMMAAEADGAGKAKGKGKISEKGDSGYELEWCVAALSVEDGDLDKARAWLKGFAPTRAETT